jgi:hypothetical protein
MPRIGREKQELSNDYFSEPRSHSEEVAKITKIRRRSQNKATPILIPGHFPHLSISKLLTD